VINGRTSKGKKRFFWNKKHVDSGTNPRPWLETKRGGIAS